MIPCCAVWLLPAAMQVQAVRFTELRNLLPQFHNALFDRILHDDRLTEPSEREIQNMVRARGTPETTRRATRFAPSLLLRAPTTVRFTHTLSNQGNWKIITITPGRKSRGYAKDDVHDQ
jgi:hypothetical protein